LVAEKAFRYSRSPRSGARKLLEELLQQLPSFPPAVVYTIIGVLASVENVFPPVPADTAVALGAFLSTTGVVSAWSVFAVTWAANVGSGAGVYVTARTLGRKFFTGRLGRRLLNPKHLHKLELLYDRYGAWGIFLSRFVPGARAIIPLFAGIAGLKSFRALVPMIVASGIWYGALTFVAATLLPKLDQVAAFVIGLNWVGLAIVVLATATVVWAALRRRQRRRLHRITTAAATDGGNAGEQ
jgi:membrane protein DedA with SNARE-associated domain